jgi:hypothetical protein
MGLINLEKLNNVQPDKKFYTYVRDAKIQNNKE